MLEADKRWILCRETLRQQCHLSLEQRCAIINARNPEETHINRWRLSQIYKEHGITRRVVKHSLPGGETTSEPAMLGRRQDYVRSLVGGLRR